jgi:hypothetical protein
MTIAQRIIDSGVVDPYDLLANPRNFRAHPEHQRTALKAALNDVGWVAPVIVNRASGTILDGHLRVAVAIERKDTDIPVDYVELSEDEEMVALATLDPITAMAKPNPHLYGKLLEATTTGEADLMAYLDDFAQRIGVDAVPSDREATGARELGAEEFDNFRHECPECGFQFD